MTRIDFPPPERRAFDFDLDTLLHPAQAFDHPDQVLLDPDLTLAEKRAILASWVSDACAVEAAPALRQPPGSKAPVPVDDILKALRKLDGEDRHPAEGARWKRMLRRSRLERLREARARAFAWPMARRDEHPPPAAA